MNAPAVRLAAGAAAVELLPAAGGAIGAFTWHGAPVLRPTPSGVIAAQDVRLTSCYPLVPYSNRIRDARLRFGSHDYMLGRIFGDHPHSIHGVGWQREWMVDHAEKTSALLRLEHDAADANRAAWPWPFRAAQAFGLAAGDAHAVLTMSLALSNTGSEAFPFGLGWHPFFPRAATTTVRFVAGDVWRNDATTLPVERMEAAGAWSFAVARNPGAATIDNVFNGWDGMAVMDAADGSFTTTIEADAACDRLVVYAPSNRDFIALEPVTHETDAFNRAHAGARDTGMRVLPPGAAFSCTMRITVASRPAETGPTAARARRGTAGSASA